MKLEFLPLGNLVVSKANMRHSRKSPDVSDILPTVRARGILQPILVRPVVPRGNGATECGGIYEIVAGARRFHAARIVAREGGWPLGCEDGRASSLGGSAVPASPDVAHDPKGDPSDNPSDDPTEHPRDDHTADQGRADTASMMLIPCAILDEADDAAAVEASLIENIARLEPDEVAQWECFTRLVREGRKPCDIAATFGITDLAVRRVLALGNLLAPIREMYRSEDIDAATVRHLTMASKSQQKAWLALAEDENSYAPHGHQLKGWLFGGTSIAVCHALFDVEASSLATVADLFGKDCYFTDPDAFWDHQNAEIAARCQAYIDADWADAVVIGPEAHFQSWEYEKTAKRKGGRVYVDVRATGEVVFHEGYLTGREARQAARRSQQAGGDAGAESGSGAGMGPGGGGIAGRPVRPELTSTMQTYVNLHRHAALRAALVGHPGVALRLMVAHAIAGSDLWRVAIDPQATRNDDIRQSVAESRGEADFHIARNFVLDLLGFDPEEPTLVGSGGYYGMGHKRQGLHSIFARLLELEDTKVLDVVGVVMGETLSAPDPIVDKVGCEIGLAMKDWWQADDAFFEGLRDREVLLELLGEVAGGEVAAANAKEKTRTMKAIIRDHLEGTNGRQHVEGWVPRWMVFPQGAYTQRGFAGYPPASMSASFAIDHEAGPEPVDTSEDSKGDDPDGSADHPTGEGGEGAESESEVLDAAEPDTDDAANAANAARANSADREIDHTLAGTAHTDVQRGQVGGGQPEARGNDALSCESGTETQLRAA